MKFLDTTFSNEFLTSLFNEMKEPTANYVTLDKIIKEFDVYKKESKFKLN
jgi:hypothetical protein